MKTRSQVYGTSNIIGKNVEKLRKQRKIKQKDFIAKLQLTGLDINPTSYSKLEGQVRAATDREVFAIAKVLGIAMEKLFDGNFNQNSDEDKTDINLHKTDIPENNGFSETGSSNFNKNVGCNETHLNESNGCGETDLNENGGSGGGIKDIKKKI